MLLYLLIKTIFYFFFIFTKFILLKILFLERIFVITSSVDFRLFLSLKAVTCFVFHALQLLSLFVSLISHNCYLFFKCFPSREHVFLVCSVKIFWPGAKTYSPVRYSCLSILPDNNNIVAPLIMLSCSFFYL